MAIIKELVGDIFSAPADSILIHACNTKGKWGAGVALAFKQKYPHAFRIYAAHCSPPKSELKSTSIAKYQRGLAGTALLIPPSTSTTSSAASSTHWIACLFTSGAYGRARDSAAQILRNAESAIADLAGQLEALEKQEGEKDVEEEADDDDDNEDEDGEEEKSKNSKPAMGECYAVPINSGNFGVPWRRTKAILEAGELNINVVGKQIKKFYDQGIFKVYFVDEITEEWKLVDTSFGLEGRDEFAGSVFVKFYKHDRRYPFCYPEE